MKAEINIPQELVEQIADRVIEKLKPLIVVKGKYDDDSILNVRALAEYVKVDENWIYQKTRKHEIPFIKKGKYCLFRKSVIDAWLNQDAIKPLSPFKMPKKQP